MNTEELFARHYYSRPEFVDGSTGFRQWCRRHIPTGGKILEVGAGPTNDTSEFLSSIGSTVGIDISQEVLGNRWLSEGRVYDGSHVPFPDSSFDACVSDFVLEHVEDPGAHFREMSRVLKPGGVYCFRTPNLWHYVSLASRLTPHAAHTLLANRLRRMSEDSHAPYPTFYRANTRVALEQFCRAAQLQVEALQMVEKEPSYGRSHWMLFYPMMWYERAVNRFDSLAWLRINIWAAVRHRKSL